MCRYSGAASIVNIAQYNRLFRGRHFVHDGSKNRWISLQSYAEKCDYYGFLYFNTCVASQSLDVSAIQNFHWSRLLEHEWWNRESNFGNRNANYSVVAKALSPFLDCTSNQASKIGWSHEKHVDDNVQWEAYIQLCDLQNAALLKKSVTLACQLHGEHVNISVEELAVEIFVCDEYSTLEPTTQLTLAKMINLSLRIVSLISGSIHVMCNPWYSWDSEKIFETGHRWFIWTLSE